MKTYCQLLTTVFTSFCMLFCSQSRVNADIVFGISGSPGGGLVTFNSNAPGTYLSSVGLDRGYGSIDFHPFTGELFGVNTDQPESVIYRIDPITGAGTSLSLSGDAFVHGFTGFFGMAFDPVTGLLRVTESNSQVNYLMNISGDSATVTRQTDFRYAPGDANFGQSIRVEGLAFSNNQILYGLDRNSNNLVSINPQADGLVNTVGSIGVSGFNAFDFDITDDNRGFFTSTTGGISEFYSIDLTTGSSTLIGGVGPSDNPFQNIRGMAIVSKRPTERYGA